MDDKLRRHIESEIADLNAGIARSKETIRNRRAMMEGATVKDKKEHETVIHNNEQYIKANEEKIAQLRRNLK